MEQQTAAGTDHITIGLFIIGVAATAFFSMIAPRPLLRKLLAFLSFVGILVGVLVLLGYLPSLAEELSSVATNAWAWFAVVMLVPIVNLVWVMRQGGPGGLLLDQGTLLERRQSQIGRDPEEQRILALAETDRGQIDLGVWLADCRVRWNPNSDGQFDCVYFEFQIFNGSSYPIRFDKIDGYIEYEGRQVRGKIEFYTGKWRLESLPPRFHTSVEIVQHLSVVDINRLRQDWEKQRFPYFSLKPLRITVADGDGLGRFVPKPLAFTHITSITLQGKLN